MREKFQPTLAIKYLKNRGVLHCFHSPRFSWAMSSGLLHISMYDVLQPENQGLSLTFIWHTKYQILKHLHVHSHTKIFRLWQKEWFGYDSKMRHIRCCCFYCFRCHLHKMGQNRLRDLSLYCLCSTWTPILEAICYRFPRLELRM